MLSIPPFMTCINMYRYLNNILSNSWKSWGKDLESCVGRMNDSSAPASTAHCMPGVWRFIKSTTFAESHDGVFSKIMWYPTPYLQVRQHYNSRILELCWNIYLSNLNTSKYSLLHAYHPPVLYIYSPVHMVQNEAVWTSRQYIAKCVTAV